jgi:hypothetical protein
LSFYEGVGVLKIEESELELLCSDCTALVPVTEPDSLLCADIKTCFLLNSENAVRQPADAMSYDTHARDLVVVQEREES